MRQDIARRGPAYLSDLKDGFHPKCIGSTLYLFFACLAPAVTFGGVMAAQTGNQIGAVEMIVASALCGIVYALVSGQPLVGFEQVRGPTTVAPERYYFYRT